MPTFDNTPKNDAFIIWIILVVFFAVSIWIMQHSVNAYYEQTYHKTSPLTKLDNEPLWRLGGQIGDWLYARHDSLTQAIDDKNSTIVSFYNNQYAFDYYYLEKQKAIKQKAILKAKEQEKRQALADEQARQKAKYTLNAGDAVFFAGDSMMQGVAPHLAKSLNTHGIVSINLAKQSTGLAYPKLFDWQKTIKTTLKNTPNIKIMVIFLGPNDPWDMPDPKTGKLLAFNSQPWQAEYQSRIEDILTAAQNQNVSVIWITPPNMKKPKLNEQMMALNDIMKQALEPHDVMVIDSRTLFKTDDNAYNDYTDKNGKSLKMRSGDGIHFTPDGQRLIADFIYNKLYIE